MLRIALRRSAIVGLQLLVLAIIVFGLSVWLPGDAADVQSGDFSTESQRDDTRELLGINTSPLTQFLSWLGHVLSGDLGTSYTQGQPVIDVIGPALGVSAIVAVVTTALLIPTAGCVGFIAGIRHDTLIDRVITTIAIAIDSIPDFVLAVVLVSYLGVQAKLFPPTFAGMSLADVLAQPSVIVLPLIVLVARVGAPLVRLVRAGVIDELSSPHIAQAQRLGVTRISLWCRHIAPNALGPALQDLGRTGDSLLSGVLVVEAIFVLPGIATTLIDAIGHRDQPVVLAIVSITGAITIVVNAAIDAMGRRMVPWQAIA